MLRHPFRTAIIAGALLAIGAVAAIAGNTTFFTGIGDLVFPFTAPSNAGATPGTIDNMTIGATTPRPGTFSQIITGSGLPTIASGACGTTTNGAVVAGSTNQSMSITIGAAATTICTISFSATLPVAPKSCVFSEMNAAAAASTVLPFIAAPTTGGVVFSGAILANTNWSIHCI